MQTEKQIRNSNRRLLREFAAAVEASPEQPVAVPVEPPPEDEPLDFGLEAMSRRSAAQRRR